MTVQELVDKRAKAWEMAKEFVNTHEDKNGNLSAEDAATYSRMEADIEELTNSIDRQQRAERREQELSKPVNSPITGKPYKDEPQGKVETGRASDEYKKAIGLINDMYAESRNDDCKYAELATQEDFDRF